MRKLLLAGVAATALAGLTGGANATVVRSFSGTGTSGFLSPPSGEPWSYGSGPSTDVGWGSPGVGRNTTASDEAVPVTDFEITFASATLDAAQIAVGNGASCGGGTFGGTTFCLSGGTVPWTAVLEAPNSIAFFAPAGASLAPGQFYFVNIMLLAGGADSAFTGAWTSGAAVPEPTSLALLGAGLAGFGLMRRRRRKVT